MSVDCSIRLLDWQKFIDANAAIENTEGLFDPMIDDAPYVIDDDGEMMFDNVSSYDAALDASASYDFIREHLSSQQRDAADQIFAALFWTFDINRAGESPWGPDFPAAPATPCKEVNFLVFDAPIKGERLYLQALLSADTVARLASLWSKSLEESIAEVAQEHFGEEEPPDGFEDNEELCEYYSEWASILQHAAEKGAGLVIAVG